jgi:hypothetical protein
MILCYFIIRKVMQNPFLIRMITNDQELKNRSSRAKIITIDKHERI